MKIVPLVPLFVLLFTTLVILDNNAMALSVSSSVSSSAYLTLPLDHITVSPNQRTLPPAAIIPSTPTIKLSPTSGPVGTIVWVYGMGFTPNDNLQINIQNGGSLEGMAKYTVKLNGAFSTYFTIPSTYSAGYHDVYAQGVTSAPPATFTVTAPTIPSGSTNQPPLIIVPQNIVTSTTSDSGAKVHYNVTAVSISGILTPKCTPASDSIFPVGDTTVSCSVTDTSGNSATKSFTVTVNPSSPSVPGWVKNIGAMWCSGQMDSSGFVQAIQWLITNHVITLPQTQQGSQSSSQNIPAWIKSDACMWSQDTIDDQTFEQAIQYLVSNGIITLS